MAAVPRPRMPGDSLSSCGGAGAGGRAGGGGGGAGPSIYAPALVCRLLEDDLE